MRSIVLRSCEYHRRRGRYGEPRLWSSNDGSFCKSDVAVIGCSCCSNRISCLVSHSEDSLAVLEPETAVVVVVVSPSSTGNKLLDPAFLLLLSRNKTFFFLFLFNQIPKKEKQSLYTTKKDRILEMVDCSLRLVKELAKRK